MQKLAKEHADLRELVDTLRQHRELGKRVEEAREMQKDPEMRELARQEENELGGEAGQARGAPQAAAPAQGSQRRQEHPPRDPGRDRRRGGGAVRQRPVPHVHPLRRAPPLEGGGGVELERGLGRPQGGGGRVEGKGAFAQLKYESGRAPRAARCR
jgi:hypothetical protein